MVEKPGLYDFDAESYHADVLTPEPALSRGGIVTLLNETPAHFAARNPRLSQWPDRCAESSREMDLGSVVHSLLLGKGSAFTVIDLADFRNKDGSPAKTFGNAQAKAAKEAAEGNGFIVLDPQTHSDAVAIAESAAMALRQKFGAWPIGESERIAIWQRKTAYGPIWCRAMMDHFSHRAATILDPKSTSKSLSDEELTKRIAYDSLDIQAAWYTEGIEAIHPELTGLVQFIFVFVETAPPFSVRLKPISEGWMTRARFRINRAADVFARCLQTNNWPTWPIDETPLSAPSWLESKWEAEELSEVEK